MSNPATFRQMSFLVLVFFISTEAIAQNKNNLQIGIFTGYGKDHYNRRLKGAGGIPAATSHFDSKGSMELGVSAEKFATRRISFLSKIYYSTQNVPTNTLCNCNHLDYLQKERHHIASLGAGVRGYLLHRSPVRAFVGISLHTDYFLGYTEKRNDNTSFHGNAQGYNRLNPGVSGEFGLQWKRVGLMGEYESNLANTFAKGYKLATGGEVRRSIFRHSYSIKLSFLITRPVSQLLPTR